MLEQYYLRPATVDRIKHSLFGDAIEQYVSWLHEKGYSSRSVLQRVPRLISFIDFAHTRGTTSMDALPEYVESYVSDWLTGHNKNPSIEESYNSAARSIRGPLYQFLRVVLPDYQGGIRGRGLPHPFRKCVPQFFPYLIDERGLSSESIIQYDHHLRYFEDYLETLGISHLSELSPAILSSYVTYRGQKLTKRSVQRFCSVLKVFLGYLYQQELTLCDLSACIEPSQ